MDSTLQYADGVVVAGRTEDVVTVPWLAGIFEPETDSLMRSGLARLTIGDAVYRIAVALRGGRWEFVEAES